MKVRELIEKLQQLPQGHEVVVDLHSEYALAGEPELMQGFDNGGYVSRPYRTKDTSKVHGYVYIPVGDR